jgi:hypothetical protein
MFAKIASTARLDLDLLREFCFFGCWDMGETNVFTKDRRKISRCSMKMIIMDEDCKDGDEFKVVE